MEMCTGPTGRCVLHTRRTEAVAPHLGGWRRLRGSAPPTRYEWWTLPSRKSWEREGLIYAMSTAVETAAAAGMVRTVSNRIGLTSRSHLPEKPPAAAGRVEYRKRARDPLAAMDPPEERLTRGFRPLPGTEKLGFSLKVAGGRMDGGRGLDHRGDACT